MVRSASGASALLLALVLALAAAPPAAAEDREATFELTDPAAEPLLMRGYRPTETLRFTIPAGLVATGPLEMSLTPLGSDRLATDATLAVSVNGVPIDSYDIAAMDRQTLPVPTEVLRSGENEVQLSALLPLAADPTCVEPDHPDRWLRLADGVVITGSFARDSDAAIQDFPLALSPLGDTTTPHLMVMPDQPDADALSAAAAVAFALARAGIETEWEVALLGDLDPASLDRPGVVVADPSLEPGAGAGAARIRWGADGNALLSIAASPEGTLTAVADALTDPLTLLPRQGDVLQVDAAPAREPVSPAATFQLQDLGYSQRTVRGLGTRSLIYRFDVPLAWELEDGAATGTVVADPGGLVIAMNGRDFSTQQLQDGDGRHALPAMTIPSTAMRPGRNFLRFTFSLQGPVDCRFEEADPAASVPPDFQIELPHTSDGAGLTLTDLPYLFASEPDMTELTVVIPDEPDAEDIEAGLRMITTLGNSDSRFAPRLMAAGEIDEATRNGHLIVLGSWGRQPVAQQLGASLPVELDADGLPRSTAAFELGGAAAGPATVQLLASPWASARAILLVTGPTAAAFDAALQATTGGPTEGQLGGPAALVGEADRNGRFPVVPLPASALAEDRAESFVEAVPLSVRIAALVVVGAAALVASAFFRRRQARRGANAAAAGH